MESSCDSFVRRALREPTLHFALLAACLFLVGAAAKAWNRPVIVIDPRAVEARIGQVERGLGRPLTEAERRIAEDAYADEQILAREARKRELDDDDRIRAILYQKMLQILGSDVREPSETELRAYFDRNRARYARPPMVTVEDVLVEEGVGSDRLEGGLDPGSVGPEGRLRRTVLTRVTEGELAWSFGEETAAMVFGAAAGLWVGPHRSGDGEHWFRVLDRITAGDAPPLEAIRDQVRFDSLAENEQLLLKQRIAELRRRYSVRFQQGNSAP